MNTTYTTMNSRKYMLFALLLSTTMVCAQQKKAKPVARKNAKPAAAAQMTAKQHEIFSNMLPNTQKIFVVDSTVVDKDSVLEAIPLSPKYGRFVSYNSFFDTDTQPNQYVFINGFANKCYYTEVAGKDSVQHLYMRNKLGDGWGEPHRISEIDKKLTDMSYPFLSSDGQTLYIAGKSNDALGKRDIYVAKYNADEGTYFEPENIGLPFNSHDDDFVYVEADAERFAWFATTRRQPAGKACVYAFVLPEQRTNYNMDEMTDAQIESRAALMRIRETWPTPEIRKGALKKLNAIKKETASRVVNDEKVNFVVNDDLVYTDINSFRSNSTRQMYFEVVRLRNDVKNKQMSLEVMRQKYHNANPSNRESLTRHILQLEQQLDDARRMLKKTETDLRNAENILLKK